MLTFARSDQLWLCSLPKRLGTCSLSKTWTILDRKRSDRPGFPIDKNPFTHFCASISKSMHCSRT